MPGSVVVLDANVLYGIEAVSPDEFTLAQIRLHPHSVLDSIDAMAARRRRSPKTRHEIIARLQYQLPHAMTAISTLSP